MEELKAEYEAKTERYGWISESLEVAKTRGCDALVRKFLLEMLDLDLRLRNLKWAMSKHEV